MRKHEMRGGAQLSHGILPENPSWGRFYLGLDLSELGPGFADLRLAWHGGHGVHVYEDDREVDFFNVGSFAREEATVDEVAEGMLAWVEELLPEEVKA